MPDPEVVKESFNIIDAVKDWYAEVGLVNIALRLGGIALLIVLAWLANFITKKFLLKLVHKLVKRSKNNWDDVLIEKKFFQRLSHFAPALVIYHCAPMVFHGPNRIEGLMQYGAQVYMLIVGLLAVDGFLNSLVAVYHSMEKTRKLPIRSFVQVIKIVLYCVAGIVLFSFVLGKDPSKLIGGLGAMTAVLMFVFKDAILGLVAGVQIAANNMVHVGDWIEMSKYGADGDVIEISLTTVKVQNWDKTIASIPTYALVSDSFRNWRGMQESGGRRIKRSLHIDMSTIKFCTSEMLEKFKKFQYISDYIEAKKTELAEHNASQNVDESEIVNGRRLTNVGTFRAYVVAYLKNHPKVSDEMTFLVRHLEPTPQGLPIQIYVFCTDKVWANYEAIQSDIFDHILAVVPQFELKVYQQPSGADFQSFGR